MINVDFNDVAGMASILSFFLSIWAAFTANSAKMAVAKLTSKSNIANQGISGSNNQQAGRDINV